MLKDKRFIAAILIVLAVVVVLDIRYFMNRGKQNSRVALPTQTHVQHTATPLRAKPAKATVATVIKNSPAQQVADWRKIHPLKAGARNPFAPQGGLGVSVSTQQATTANDNRISSRRLEAIAMVNGTMTALIDGEPVTTHQQVGNLTVENIDPNQVTVRQGTTRWAESLPPLPTDGIHIVRNR